MPTDANRRRNQIVAQRCVEKVHRENQSSRLPEKQLWRELIECLERTQKTRVWLGHTDEAARAARALNAALELQLRGTQLQLPL